MYVSSLHDPALSQTARPVQDLPIHNHRATNLSGHVLHNRLSKLILQSPPTKAPHAFYAKSTVALPTAPELANRETNRKPRKRPAHLARAVAIHFSQTPSHFVPRFGVHRAPNRSKSKDLRRFAPARTDSYPPRSPLRKPQVFCRPPFAIFDVKFSLQSPFRTESARDDVSKRPCHPSRHRECDRMNPAIAPSFPGYKTHHPVAHSTRPNISLIILPSSRKAAKKSADFSPPDRLVSPTSTDAGCEQNRPDAYRGSIHRGHGGSSGHMTKRCGGPGRHVR